MQGGLIGLVGFMVALLLARRKTADSVHLATETRSSNDVGRSYGDRGVSPRHVLRSLTRLPYWKRGMAVAKVMKRFLAWLVAKFFPPKPIKELEVKEEADPYRPTPPAEEEHPIDCKGCEWLDNYGRWQPPGAVFEAGIPFSCLMV